MINATIEELSLPIFSINCNHSHVKIDDGISLSKRLCGKQPKQMLYSRNDITIELFVDVLTESAKLCFSYSYGWYYEAAIADKDIHVPTQNGRVNTPVEVWLSAPVDSAKGTFLIVADFLKDDRVLTVKVASGLSIVDIYDGPGPMSPMIIRLMEYANASLPVQFYLYLEFYILGIDNKTKVYYETVNSYSYPEEKREREIYGKKLLQCRNQMYMMELYGTNAYADVTVKSDPGVNTWCRLRVVGKSLVLQLETFKFMGPTVQHIHENYTMCQFGGVYIAMDKNTKRAKFMSLCDESMLSEEVLVHNDRNVLYVYIAYFAGYSEGLSALKIKTGSKTKSQTGQQCDGRQEHCKFTHTIWTNIREMFSNKDILSDDIYTYQFINPPFIAWQHQHYSTAHMSPTVHISAGSQIGYVTLGTVLLHVEIITRKSLPTACFHQINMETVSESSNTKVSSFDNVLFTNKTTTFPSAKYISIMIHLCSYLHARNQVIVRVRLEKLKVCDVVNLFPWPSQIAGDCSHLSVPHHLGSISFYTVLLHVYKLTINDGCVDKSCLEITITAYGYYTDKCDVLWENTDASTLPMNISFPGKLNITWKTKASCSLDDLRKCDLEIDIRFKEFPEAIRHGHVTILNKNVDKIVLQRNTRKETIFLNQ